MFKKIAIIFLFIFMLGFSRHVKSNLLTSASPNSVITLVSGLSNPNGIATDSVYVYWLDYGSGTVNKVSVNGGTTTTLVSGLYSPTGILLDNNDIYFGEYYGNNASRIKKVSKNGGTVTTLVSNLYSICQLTMDATYIYFSDGNSLIQKILKTGGTVTTLSNSSAGPSGVIVKNNYVYWIEFSNPGTLKKVSINGGTTTTLADNSNTIGIASDGNFIYWTEYVFLNSDKVKKISVNGGTVTELATGLNNLWDIAIDKTNVYWVENRMSGAIKQIPLNGGQTTVIADSNINEPVRITADSLYVYWVERNGGGTGTGYLKKANKSFVTGINAISNLTPSKYNLYNNYPNPFNPVTVISYQLPVDSYITLKVYDILGRDVTTLVNSKQIAGYYTAEFNSINFASGIYFYRLTANVPNAQEKDFVMTKKMVVVR